MSKRKKKKAIDARLAIKPNINNVNKQPVKSAMADDKEACLDVAHTAGRKGYAERAKGLGVFYRITTTIKKFRTENMDSSFSDLYVELHNKFPFVFETEPENMYSSNFKKVIEAEPLWCSAYYILGDDLETLAELRMQIILEDENTEASTIISAYDKVKKYKLAEKQLNSNKSDSKDKEIVFTFDI